jgi:dTDP-4-dehydrorhamnose reductase
MKVVVLGASGMLGSMLMDFLIRQDEFQVTGTARSTRTFADLAGRFPSARLRFVDAETCTAGDLISALKGAEWVINAIGVIKPYIHDEMAGEVERAAQINVLFPYILARAAERISAHVLQIATDCVYSGHGSGAYVESNAHDALDVYGKTKSLGEVYSPNVSHLRCSIIGPEPKGHVSLLDWFLSRPKNDQVTGYFNHEWNGVTTLQFAKLCLGIITNSLPLPHVQHIVPGSSVSKYELLRCFAEAYGRSDLTVVATEAPAAVDRTLATANERRNCQLWAAAGYPVPPPISEMVAELARFDYMGALT